MLTGFVRGFPTFIALRVLLGVGEAPFYPAGVRSIARVVQPRDPRPARPAVMSSSQTIGLAIAPPMLTAIMLRLGWRAMFIVLGAAGLLVAAAWIALHRARQRDRFRTSRNRRSPTPHAGLPAARPSPPWRALPSASARSGA